MKSVARAKSHPESGSRELTGQEAQSDCSGGDDENGDHSSDDSATLVGVEVETGVIGRRKSGRHDGIDMGLLRWL